jgi:hypothetical protein
MLNRVYHQLCRSYGAFVNVVTINLQRYRASGAVGLNASSEYFWFHMESHCQKEICWYDCDQSNNIL